MNERQKKVLNLISTNPSITVKRLAEASGVSSVTIRQDLNLLESEGFIKRIHGGAVLSSEDDISYRLGINYDKKLKIAKLASSFIKEGDTIFIESGSINALLAKELVSMEKINIITTNVFIVRQLRKNKMANIILLGGIYQTESESLVGTITKTCLSNINFNKCFIGIDGFSINSGFTSKDLQRSEIASCIIKNSEEVFILSDSSKFGVTELTKFCDCGEVDHIITDTGLNKEYTNFLKNNQINVLTV